MQERNQTGTTVFLSSHVLSEIQRNCSKAAIIRDGEVIACDSVEALSRTNAKRVVVHGSVDLSELKGIRDLQTENHSMSFLYSGEMQALLQRFSEGYVEDLTICEPDLEEIFLHYYEKKEEM